MTPKAFQKKTKMRLKKWIKRTLTGNQNNTK